MSDNPHNIGGGKRSSSVGSHANNSTNTNKQHWRGGGGGQQWRGRRQQHPTSGASAPGNTSVATSSNGGGSVGGGSRGGGNRWPNKRGGSRGRGGYGRGGHLAKDVGGSTDSVDEAVGGAKRGRSQSGPEDEVLERPMSHGGGQRNPRREGEGSSANSNSKRHRNKNKNRNSNDSNSKHNLRSVYISGPIASTSAQQQATETSDASSSNDTDTAASAATSSPRFTDRQIPPRGASRSTIGTNTTPQTIRPRQGPSTVPHQHRSSLVMPTPDGVSPLQDPTVFVSPYVRLVAEGEDNSTTVRTLESLLKYGTANIGSEEDTPFLAPSAGPMAALGSLNASDVGSMLKLNGNVDVADSGLGNEDEELAFVGNPSMGCVPAFGSFAANKKPPSPGLHFSLDGVATPNTWGAIACAETLKQGGLASIPQMISLPPATDPHTGVTDFCSGLSSNKSISTPESSMYRFLMNDYCRERDEFGYRATSAEAKAKFMARISDLCVKVTSILEQECLMCAVATPVYVLGDVHGNFCDLSYFLKSVLAFNDIHLSPCNILCLGDYVDRGPYSLECILLLLALKATAPAKVTLLRGNHEDRVVCGDRRTYGNDCFLAQCQGIFGQADGLNVFIMVTEVFRHLPLAAEIVVSNAPNNPQAPRDLADEDDWESVPNNSIAKSGGKDSEGVIGMGNSPSTSTNLGNLGLPPSNVTGGTRKGIHSANSSAAQSCQQSPYKPTTSSNNNSPSAAIIYGNSLTNTPAIPPKTPKNAFRVEQSGPRDVRKMFTDRNWLRRQTHVERILCTHGGIPRFSGPPKEADSLAFLRSPNFPRLLTLFPNNPFMRDYQPAEVERFRNVPEEVMQRAWFTMFDLMWSDPTIDDSNVNEWGFGINTRGTTVVSFSAKAVEMFLDAYKYSMLFRAHQEKAHGIRLSKSKKVLTIFSTSNYLGHGNGAGCAVVSPYGEVQLIVKTSD